MKTLPLLDRFEFEVISLSGGVYHFRRFTDLGEEESVGLLFGPAIVSKQQRTVKLFLQESVPGVPIARIIRHWQIMDARRLEESGLSPIKLEIPLISIPDTDSIEQFRRPEDNRTRVMTTLKTGECICYN